MKSSKRPSMLTGVRNERAPDWLRCVRCGYALKGLPVDGLCPECGSPVRRSIPGGLLEGLDVLELWRIRSRIGFWALALVLMLAVWPSLALACPTLTRYGGHWVLVHALVQCAATVFVGVAWLPLMAVRTRAIAAPVRWAAVLAPAFLWTSVLPRIMSVPVELRIAHRGATGPTEWLAWAFLALTALHALLLTGFFMAGSRYSLELTHADRDDRRTHKWVARLGCAGALGPAIAAGLMVPVASQWLLRLGVTREWLAGIEYGLGAGGAVLIGAACLVWAGAWNRIDRCALEYIAANEEERLKQQLAGVV
ncbi:MAG: hypothetical protein QM783_17745 [Phycisphaerales bacterium]